MTRLKQAYASLMGLAVLCATIGILKGDWTW